MSLLIIVDKPIAGKLKRNSLNSNSIVISAGVGRSITFEIDLANKYCAKILLLDPSPTGIATINNTENLPASIEFKPLGLTAQSGTIAFDLPENPEEGSYKIAQSEAGAEQFQCLGISELVDSFSNKKIDLLKIDIEGFEYELLDCVIRNKIAIDQICVEIHHNRAIAINHSIIDAAILIFRLYLAGYRIIYNKKMDFTFIKKITTRQVPRQSKQLLPHN